VRFKLSCAPSWLAIEVEHVLVEERRADRRRQQAGEGAAKLVSGEGWLPCCASSEGTCNELS